MQRVNDSVQDLDLGTKADGESISEEENPAREIEAGYLYSQKTDRKLTSAVQPCADSSEFPQLPKFRFC